MGREARQRALVHVLRLQAEGRKCELDDGGPCARCRTPIRARPGDILDFDRARGIDGQAEANASAAAQHAADEKRARVRAIITTVGLALLFAVVLAAKWLAGGGPHA